MIVIIRSVIIKMITRAFFRRGIGKPYCCVEGKGDCTIDFTSRRSCQWCRFDKYAIKYMDPGIS